MAVIQRPNAAASHKAKRRSYRNQRRHRFRYAGRISLLVIVVLLAVGTVIHDRTYARLGAETETGSLPPLAQDSGSDGPVIAIGSLETGASPAPGVVSLTFDDGPHPVWTPLILDVLDELQVKATFFVVGEQVRAHPEITREIASRGHDLGNHTFTHPAMGALTSAQRSAQLEETRLAIIAATGIDTALYRAPFSSAFRYFSTGETEAASQAAEAGYVVVATDRAASDYEVDQPRERLLEQATPPPGTSAIITLHDGGGNRSSTVAILPELVRRVREGGANLTPVTEIVAESAGIETMHDADPVTKLRAHLFFGGPIAAKWIERIVIWGAAIVFGAHILRWIVLGSIASYQRRRRVIDLRDRVQTDGLGVSVIVPAYNEAVGIEDTVRSIAASSHRDLEILVVDDGSTDRTSEIVSRIRDIPNLRLVRKNNRGKYSALNVGVLEARHDVLVMVDGDTILERDTIPHLIAPLADPNVGAVSGNPKIGNQTGLLPRVQAAEYLLSSSLERRIQAPARLLTTIPGAIGAWRRSAVADTKLVSGETLAEDTDLTIGVARAGWRVAYAPEARAWTEAPATFRTFWRQRLRWAFGNLQVMAKHKGAAVRSGTEGRLGRIGLPNIFMSEVLFTLLAPLIDVIVLVQIAQGNWRLAALTWGFITLLTTIVAAFAARLDGDPMRVALYSPLRFLILRPMLYGVALAALTRAILGKSGGWGAQTRQGGLRVGGVATS